jgi:large subunit ribosomal protein L25
VETKNLNGEMRMGLGSGACHRLREEGLIPAVMYGSKNQQAQPVQVDRRELESIISRHGGSAIITMSLDNGTKNIMIKEIQRHPVDNTIIHADFYEVSSDTKITTIIPIVLKGREFVEKGGGVIQTHVKELEIECLPQYLPKNIEVDVSKLSHGKALKVMDLEISQEISILNKIDDLIASLTYVKAEQQPDDNLSEPTPIVEA